MLAFFPNVKTFYRAVVAHNPGIHQAFGSEVLVFLQQVFSFGFHVYDGLSVPIRYRRISGNIHVRRSDSHVPGKR